MAKPNWFEDEGQGLSLRGLPCPCPPIIPPAPPPLPLVADAVPQHAPQCPAQGPSPQGSKKWGISKVPAVQRFLRQWEGQHVALVGLVEAPGMACLTP